MPILYAAFALSGAAALIYETTWTRLLTLFMGHTVAAAGAVLGAFMGGLAAGAAVAARVSGRLDRRAALRAYAVVELLIAGFALLLPLELTLLEPLLASAYADGSGGQRFAAIRLICALLVVTIPAIAMGATLPLAIRWLATSAALAGRDTGRIYAANTIGAASGAVLSGFVLLPALGIRMTTAVAVALNGAAAAMAWWLASRPPGASPSEPVPASRSRRTHQRSHKPTMPRLAMFALAASGCASLVLQVAWTRTVALLFGPTTFAFSAMVATFIAGIAIGAMLGAWVTGRPLRPSAVARLPLVLAACLAASAVAAAAAAGQAPSVSLVIADAVAAPGATFRGIVQLQWLLAAALMLPMTIGFGAAFPIGVALASGDDAKVSGQVGYVYMANTLGAIAGALAGAFVLVPRLGLQNTVRAAAALLIAAASVLALAHARRRPLPMASTIVATVAALAVLTLMPPWDREILSSGAYKYAAYMEAPHRKALLRAGRLLYYAEGAAATVSVRELTGARSLAIDGKVDASNAGDMLTQRLLAHLPLLLHPAPRSVAVIGLGSGVTLGSALRHPIERADMLEISPEVVAASRFFERENHGALADARTRLIVGDGRTHLALGRQQYDVIISEPSNPWMAGVAALFTQEFFSAVRARLNDGGIVCQWAHTYDIAADDLRSIVATFTSVFPYATLWLVGDADVLLVGSANPLEPRLGGIRTAWSRPGVAADLDDVKVRDAGTLLTLFAADRDALRAYAAEAPVQHDDRMSLEFSAPRGIYGRTTADNAAALRALAASQPAPEAVRAAWDDPATPANRGVMHLRGEAFRSAFEDFARALEHTPGEANVVDGLLQAAAGARRVDDAAAILKNLLHRDPQNVAVATRMSRLIAARGDFAAAGEPLRPLLATPQPDLRVIDQLASLFADAGDAESLSAVVADLQRIAPDTETALYYSAALHFMAGRPPEAIAAGERLRARNSHHAKGLNLLGAAYAMAGRAAEARRAFRESIAADPRDPGTYVNLGTFELQTGRADEAEEYFAEALTIDPASTAAQEGLMRALAALR